MPTNYNGGLIINGTDGIAPVYEPDSVSKIWFLNDIFQGQEGKNKYVPKIGDWVIDRVSQEIYECISIDFTTMIPELRALGITLNINKLKGGSKLISTDRHIDHETWRVYLDTSTNPYTLAVDARYKVVGSTAHHAQIVRGSRINNTAEVISMIYDQYGKLVDQNITLEKALVDSAQVNHCLKAIPPCHTTANMPDGELVTVLIYDDQGGVVSGQEMVVENTALIRQTDTAVKYIQGISLTSPFMDDSDPTLLKYPMNVPVRGLNLFGIVHYTDGSTLTLPVDNTRFSVFGLRDYVTSIESYTTDFTLKYSVGNKEIPVRMGNGNNVEMSILGDKFVTKHYRASTIKKDDAYSVKLFGYPVWIDDINGYKMDWYLTNMERSFCLYVTPYVRFNANREPFNGLAYGAKQRLSVSINLKDATITAKDYIHTQVIDVQLQRAFTDKMSYPWSIGFEIDQFPYYGIDNFAYCRTVNQNLKKLDVSLGERNLDTWLERVFYKTKPIFDPNREASAPTPNVIKLVTPSGREFSYPISMWNQQMEVNSVLGSTDCIYIQFIRRANDTDMYLGISAIPIIEV